MPEILLSSAAIWSRNPIEYASQTQASPKALAEMTSEAGYRGWKYHPLRRATSLGRAVDAGQFGNLIRSWHQSFRDEKNILQALEHLNAPARLAIFAVYQERLASLQWIEDYERRFGKKLPVTAYMSDTQTEISPTDFYFSETLVQPTKDELRKAGVDNLPDFFTFARRRGWSGFVADLTHLQTIGDWQEVLPQILEEEGGSEVHIALGRTDMRHEDPKTVQKLDDLYHGRKKTEVFEMLRTVKKLFGGTRIVDEIPATSLVMLRAKNKDRDKAALVLDDRRRIVDQLTEELL